MKFWPFGLLKAIKNLEAIGMEKKYFACEKHVNFRGPGAECYGLNVCVSKNSCVEILMPNMMILRNGKKK